MSKTLEKNLETPNETNFWKRCVAWGIALKLRYQRSIFFSTQWNIVLFHVCSVVAIVLVVAGLLYHTNEALIDAVSNTLESLIANPAHPNTGDILERAVAELKTLYIFVLSAILVFAGFSGYAATRITLRPSKKALELQKRFVSNIAHELRTPLAVLKTTNEVALFDIHDKDAREVVETTLEEVDRMENTINTILSFDNLERSEALIFVPVSLDEVIETTLNRMHGLADKKKITLQEPPKMPQVVMLGNKAALEQMALNIVKNAVLYTPTGGTVTITALHTKGRHGSKGTIATPGWLAGISVSDSGIGIPPEDLPHIFEPFYRASTARSRNGGGSGIGLSIVYEIVKLHNGKITVESIPGTGTTVTALFPSTTVAEETQESVPDSSVSHSFLS
jgi:signal transduction histidine kinase